MSDEEKAEQEKAEKENKEKEALALAEAKKTETQKEHMIPKSRFDDEIKKRKDAEEKLAIVEKETASRIEKQLEEDGKWKDLYEASGKKIAELQPIADRVEEQEETLKDVLDASVEQIPEDLRGLVPEKLNTKDKLDWISANSALLHKSKPFDIGAGKLGGTNNKGIDLNSEQKDLAKAAGMTEEEYVKYSDKE